MNMNNMDKGNIYSNVTTFTKDTEDCTTQLLGGFSESTEYLHSVSVHDCTKVTRNTRTIKGGVKVTTITIHTDNGNITINAFA